MDGFIKAYIVLLLYFAFCATAALILRHFVNIPREIFRKTLHIILLGSIFIITNNFPTWWTAAIGCLLFAIMVYPILMLAEKIPGYANLLIERKSGEIKKSLMVVFAMFTVLICTCWGGLGLKYLVVSSVLAWGLGDAAAALVGKKYGKNYIEGKFVEGRKSIEGTIAMFVVSFLSVCISLFISVPLEWYVYIVIGMITAAVCSVVELYTKGGMDTLTCPFSAAFTMIILLYLWGGVVLL